MINQEYIDKFIIKPGRKVNLKDFDTGFVVDERHKELSSKATAKARAAELLEKNLQELTACQEKLYADDRYAILVILQAMDASGKDGTIKHVMSGVNPQGCQVYSFKQPSSEELDHTFLWRCMTRLPERGRIGIFNRSYYEDVLVVKVHPEFLEKQRLPSSKVDESFWKDRYDDINSFEKHLVHNGTIVVKFFLHVSKKKQKERLLERLERPEKNWKFSVGDLAERARWDEYMKVYEDALTATSTKHAPWYVIPADHKWVTRTLVADILVSRLQELELRYPEVSADQKKALAAARKQLEAD